MSERKDDVGTDEEPDIEARAKRALLGARLRRAAALADQAEHRAKPTVVSAPVGDARTRRRLVDAIARADSLEALGALTKRLAVLVVEGSIEPDAARAIGDLLRARRELL